MSMIGKALFLETFDQQVSKNWSIDNVQALQYLDMYATFDVAMAQAQSLKFAFTFCVFGPSLHLTVGILKKGKVVFLLAFHKYEQYKKFTVLECVVLE